MHYSDIIWALRSLFILRCVRDNTNKTKVLYYWLCVQRPVMRKVSSCHDVIIIITRHAEPNYILQPPKNLVVIVKLFRYINNNVTEDKCSIPIDMTIVLRPTQFSLQANIDHNGPSMYSGHCTTPINCCKKHSIAMTAQLPSVKWLIAKTPLPHM